MESESRKNIEGKILFLDRENINTDEIIPAKYLTEGEKEDLKQYLLEDLILEDFNSKKDVEGKSIIVSRTNFGCGSSREHAVWALEQNGIYAVIAESFGSIFKRNMFNEALLAIELSKDKIDRLFRYNKDITAKIYFDDSKIDIIDKDQTEEFDFKLSDFDRAVFEASGWVNYADKRY